MKNDREKWDGLYEEKQYASDFAPIIEEFVLQAESKGVRALDIASGVGVHARYLAKMGYQVDALDISPVALAQLAEVPGITAICEDLDFYEIPELRYDLIIQVKFCGRRLFPQIIEALKPGGLFIMETFLRNPDSAELTFPYLKDYLLRSNELLRVFAPLRVLYYKESPAFGNDGSDAWKASFVGVKPKG